MLETDLFYAFIDSPTEWNIASDEIDIRGWIVAKTDEELSDVRARLDGVITYGIMGWDRPDLQAQFDGRVSALRSGFKIVVHPWLGAKQLILEVRRPGHVWNEFFRTDLTTSGDQMPARQPKPLLKTEVIEESLFYLYRHFHYESGVNLRAEAARVLDEVTTAFTPMLPENDLIGFLDLPDFWINAHYEKFRVSGWAFSQNRTIAKLAASISCVTENRLIWGKEREDVLFHNPQWPQALKSAFYGLVDVRPDSYSPACLKIWVEYPDGPRQLIRSKRIYLNKINENTGPIPVYSHYQFARVLWAFAKGVLAGRYAVENWGDFWKAVKKTRRELADKMIRGGKTVTADTPTPWSQKEPFELWSHHNRLTPRLLKFLAQEAEPLVKSGPTISIVVPTYNTPTRFLDELIAAVQAQVYPNWELCFADDCSPQAHVVKRLTAAAEQDSRIKFTVRTENGHISAATNSALELATGEYIAFLDHDDLIPADALLHVAETITRHPAVDFLYTDEDKLDAAGRHYDPQFKGDWNPVMAISHNYTHHFRIIRRNIVEAVGGLRVGYEGAQDIDLILRCVEQIKDPANIRHVPFVCYHWRAHEESTAQRGDQKGYLFDAARRAITDAVKRRGLRAEVFIPPHLLENALCLHQLKWSPDLLAENPVTIVIPSRDQATLLQACVESLERTVNWAHVKLLVVDDGSTEPDALQYLESLENRRDRPWRVLRAGDASGTFNYSRLVNLGTAAADTPLILHLNNDVEAIESGWLEDMVGWMSVENVGVVGARLIHRDETLNHAGIWISPDGGLAHDIFVGLPKDDFGYLFLPHAARNTSAVTGACLLTRRSLYEELGGFDEKDFQVAYNDVDYCLRATAAGQRAVYSPQATLIHLGSASRGITYTEREHLAFVQKYPGFRDPHFSASLKYAKPNFKIDAYDHRFARRELGLNVAVVTHNLNIEGAPLFIFEYARFLAQQPGWNVQVFCPHEGPLREKFENAGMTVEILESAKVRLAPDAATYRRELKSLAASLDWTDFDLIVGNTMLTYWLVPLGQHLNLPVELYIHESNTPRRFFAEHNLAAPEVIPLVDEAIGDANRIVFTAKATWDIFADLNVRDNFRLLNSWVDLDRIEKFIAANPKDDLRRQYGLDPAATLVVNIGSICQRKGQHVFVRAIDHLLKTHGDDLKARGKVEFLMVGAREGLYLESVEQDIELMEIGSCTRLYPETLNIYDWYRMADIFVCTSFEESFPRVLLESACFRLPIVSTDVNGIPEMLIANDEAHLIKAGDHHVLADTLKITLDQFLAGDDLMVSRALTRMSRFYDARVSLAAHLAMAREAYFD